MFNSIIGFINKIFHVHKFICKKMERMLIDGKVYNVSKECCNCGHVRYTGNTIFCFENFYSKQHQIKYFPELFKDYYENNEVDNSGLSQQQKQQIKFSSKKINQQLIEKLFGII